MQKYIIAIEPGDEERDFSVVVPDLPGCYSAGKTLEEAIDNAAMAAGLWLKMMQRQGHAIPLPTPFSRLQSDATYRGYIWSVIRVVLPGATSD